MSFNVRALSLSPAVFLPRPWSGVLLFLNRQERFLIQTSETKNGCRYIIFIRIFPVIFASWKRLLTPMKFIICRLVAEVKAISGDHL
jgi:hypothetical protein